jgi:hypothetical protein
MSRTTRRRARRKWQALAFLALALFLLLYLLGYYLGPDKNWRTPSGHVTEEQR